MTPATRASHGIQLTVTVCFGLLLSAGLVTNCSPAPTPVPIYPTSSDASTLPDGSILLPDGGYEIPIGDGGYAVPLGDGGYGILLPDGGIVPVVFDGGSTPMDAGTTPGDGGSSDAGVDAGGRKLADGGSCTSDSQCGAGGPRCCVTDGLCYATVGEYDDCDCQHPCPSDQGCYPLYGGACPGTGSGQCAPACFPGSFTTNMAAQACAAVDAGAETRPAYCTALPAAEDTPQNQGGVCALGDNCNVISQNCPEFPLNRSQPVSNSNPLVPQNCMPAAPAANVCVAAGQVPVWGINCDQSCTNLAVDCAAGSICVTTVDDQGNAIGPSECRQQCSTPGGTSSDCPATRPNCEGTYAAGMVYYPTGVCTESPCVADSECASFSATPCCNEYGVCDVCSAPDAG